MILNSKTRQEPKFLPLDKVHGWKESSVQPEPRVIVDSAGYLALPAVPTGPLGFVQEVAASDGKSEDERRAGRWKVEPRETLGGLVPPRWIAECGRGRIFLLDKSGSRLLRYSLRDLQFEVVNSIGPSQRDSRERGRFGERGWRDPQMIAGTPDALIVVDGVGQLRRILVFHPESLALLHVMRRQDWLEDSAFDLAARRDEMYVLEAGRDSLRVRRFDARGVEKSLSINLTRRESENQPDWRRVVLDREGRLYLLNLAGEKAVLEEIEPVCGEPGYRVANTYHDAREVAGRFDRPAMRLDHLGRLRLADDYLSACAGEKNLDSQFVAFGPSGERSLVDPAAAPATSLVERSAMWFSQALDGRLYRCPWHRIEVEVEKLPPGARVEIDTITGSLEDGRRTGFGMPERLWQRNPALSDRLNHALGSRGEYRADGDESAEFIKTDFLVQNPPGQILFLRIRLTCDGRTTPRLRRLRVHFPRDSYVQHLPAIFSEDVESRGFLERFLYIFQREWDEIEDRVENTFRYFDPETVPDAYLPYLASWLNVPLEGDWRPEQNRRLLASAVRSLGKRGTPKALRDHISVYLHNFTGIFPKEQEPYPIIVEGFRQRPPQRLGVSLDDDHGSGLWGREVVGRMQLGEYGREGEARMLSVGSPDTDYFRVHAHRFHVLVPAPWLSGSGQVEMLRRAITEESPAHVCHELCLIDAHSVVGTQARVGFDTIVGGPCSRPLPGESDEEHSNRLGVDTWLPGDSSAGGGIRAGEDTRIGPGTVIE